MQVQELLASIKIALNITSQPNVPAMPVKVWCEHEQNWVEVRGFAIVDGEMRIQPIESKRTSPIEALNLAINVAHVAHDYWDKDQDSKVGKILLALMGKLPGYRIDTDLIRQVVDAQTKQKGSDDASEQSV